MTSKEIRQSFLDFMASKGHQVVPSAPMVIKDDPTLMFTNAGMNPWKGIILGNDPTEEKRDLALVMSKEITCGQVEDCIKESCAYVTDVKLFDVYEGKPIPEDKKSMAFTVVFTPKDEEFAADSVDGFVETILKKLNKKLEIELRA